MFVLQFLSDLMTSPGYRTHLGVMLTISIVIISSFSFLLGGAGVFNLAHVGTVAIGAYTSALLTLRLGWPFGFALLAAVAVGVCSGLLLALLLRKIRGDYLALLSYDVYAITMIVLLNWPSLTRGALGLPGIPRPALFATPVRYLVLTTTIAAIVLAVNHRILRSPYGRAMAAARDDEIAARAFGKRVEHLRMSAYLISSGSAALGGVLLAHYIQFIDPHSFPLLLLALALAGAIVGGIGTTAGAIAGAAIVLLVPESLRSLTSDASTIGALRQIVFAGIILLVLFLRPRGIFGTIDVR